MQGDGQYVVDPRGTWRPKGSRDYEPKPGQDIDVLEFTITTCKSYKTHYLVIFTSHLYFVIILRTERHHNLLSNLSKSLTTQAARARCMCSGRGSFYLAFFYLASRIFYLASRIFLSRISHFLSRISHFSISYLAFSPQKLISLKFISHLACPHR